VLGFEFTGDLFTLDSESVDFGFKVPLQILSSVLFPCQLPIEVLFVVELFLVCVLNLSFVVDQIVEYFHFVFVACSVFGHDFLKFLVHLVTSGEFDG